VSYDHPLAKPLAGSVGGACPRQRQLRGDYLLAVLTDLFARDGPPAYIRPDNGADFTAIVVREELGRVEVKALYFEPGSPVGKRLQ
jgi:hypothetical protein